MQLDDELVERLDRLADQQGTSRSDLLRRGAVAVLEASELAAADRELQESYRRISVRRPVGAPYVCLRATRQ